MNASTPTKPAIEEVRARVDELKHATLHGPVPLKTTMQLVIDADFLLTEVDRLTEQWNTRFDTLCGLCGNRYRGPRDNDRHGYGKCG